MTTNPGDQLITMTLRDFAALIIGDRDITTTTELEES